MNKEIYERLKPYSIHLRRGYKGNYVYGLLQKDFDVLYEIYGELGGKSKLKYSCNSCNLQLLKFLGKLYFEYEEKQVVSEDVSEDVSLEKPDGVKEKKKSKNKKRVV